MKSPDEIKKGLECCAASYADCHKECPYKLDCDGSQILKDALALIQQLESDKQQLEGMLAHMNQLRDAAAGRALEMEERVHQLEAERDAAVADILYAASVYLGECNTCKNGEVCAACKRQDACDECPNSKCMCSGCGVGRSNWQWRGVQKEDAHEQ